ncbi:MAG: hypothetical protein N3A72_03045 [bacterium]|nr:hypothetical protein [bacterium]
MNPLKDIQKSAVILFIHMEQSSLLSLCNEFGYPTLIHNYLSEIQVITEKSVSDILSILLLGSTARGEFSYRIEPDGQISLWSDIELLAVSKRKPSNTERKRLFVQLAQLEKKWNKNSPLFHIDCSYISLRQVQQLPPLIRHYEAKKIGKTIFGTDIRSEIPEINCDNLDYRELAEVILWRLWAIALYVPRSWLITKPKNGRTEGNNNQELFNFVLCRNSLDLTTYLLPWEKVLLSSFRERVDYIREHYPDLQLRRYFNSSFPDFLNQCLDGKFKFIFPESTEQLYQQTLAYFIQAGKHLLAVNNIKVPDTELPNILEKYQTRLFNEYKFRRKVYELTLVAKHFNQRTIYRWWNWYWQGKIGKMISCLYHLHFAFRAIAIINDLPEAEFHLRKASQLVSQLTLRRLPVEFMDLSIPIGERWIWLRKIFGRFLMDLYQSIGQKEDYLSYILEGHIER